MFSKTWVSSIFTRSSLEDEGQRLYTVTAVYKSYLLLYLARKNHQCRIWRITIKEAEKWNKDSLNETEDEKNSHFLHLKNTGLTNVSEHRETSKFFSDVKQKLKWNHKSSLYFTRPIFLASVSYINNLHILTIKTSASSSSTCRRKRKIPI